MVRDLATAIMDRYNSSDGDDLRAVVTGMWQDHAPDESTLPYVTFNFVSLSPSYTMAQASEQIDAVVDIHVWHDSTDVDDALAIGDKVRALYDLCTLSINGATCQIMHCVDEHVVYEPDGGWQWVATYEILAGK